MPGVVFSLIEEEWVCGHKYLKEAVDVKKNYNGVGAEILNLLALDSNSRFGNLRNKTGLSKEIFYSRNLKIAADPGSFRIEFSALFSKPGIAERSTIH